MTRLLVLRPWLTVRESADYLSERLGEQVSQAQVLRFALDNLLTLSLNLPAGMTAYVNRGPDEKPGWEPVDGLWDLPLDGAARRQVEHEYNFSCRLSSISMEKTKGATVRRGASFCELEASPNSYNSVPSAFPPGSTLVATRERLDALIVDIRQQLPPAEPAGTSERSASSPNVDEKALDPRERSTLLIIIAALCENAGIDRTRASAAGATIEALVAGLGAKVAAGTIERHLKRIPDALERKQD